ncbi:hypothetical protein PTSG_02308 [Salpingoeca rosetta]|uniref:GCK domain-containing protein n=1 Tax=Salpingoeca rosetta (strain ATCC 50818 / BSB-021) TaxID=946362 RepID=F2U1U1_SALR5|nr:uncharacterized protein PTSG_02308 [Salpingoeca rosetta]EGD81593.1 hypothetical protein PTSG_02308 [Salpingoeca rosetta]|eukprot:XP_004996797.1 hypothetical protein PTSG_02308 [Salpingoeca rosetta]
MSAQQEEKDVVIFTTPESEEEMNIVEDKDKAPLRPDLGEAVGPSGEIDWDCPCLQGMADGPCGETFKAAFSCFVYSQAEEKGSDCIQQFEAMHECFNQHADYYAGDEGEQQSKTDATEATDTTASTQTTTEAEAHDSPAAAQDDSTSTTDQATEEQKSA